MSKLTHRLAALFVSAAIVFTIGSARAADALPDGYTRVEYVKGDGTAWIDLKTKLTLADKVVAKARIPATPTVGIVYGSRTSSSAQDCFIWGMDAAKTPAMSMDIVNTTASTGGRLNVSSYAALCGHLLVATNCAAYRRIIDLDSGTEYKNETVMTQDFTSPFDIRLFWASGTVWASATQCFVGEIHSLAIIRDDVPRMDLVPCIDPNGVVGFYDLVGKDFYQKDATATGAFTPGPRTNQDGELEYLISADAGADGTISINGGTPAAKVSAWVKAGEDAEVVFTPSVAGTYRLFNGTPASMRMPKANRVVFAADNPYSLTLAPYAHEDEFFAYTGDEVTPIVVGERTVYVFTKAQAVSLAVKKDLTLEEGLVVGGGGGGGTSTGAGGGGLVRITDRHLLPAGESISLAVGKGGNQVAWYTGHPGYPSRYADSTVSIVANGGGGGYYQANTEYTKDGGCGGGSGGKGTAGQGCDGAAKVGAGGGADQPGQETGIGGNGLWLDITGEWHCYASGGGAVGKAGGAESGGRGMREKADTDISQNGLAGFGGGGGARTGYAGSVNTPYCNGGSGTVILSLREGDTRTRTFDVEPIGECTPVNGFATPEPVVRFGDALLEKDRDYSVSYAHNDNLGCTGWAVITGLGDYSDIVVRVPFKVAYARFAKIDGSSEASGTSWDDAMDLPTALAGIAAGDSYEIWVAAGTYELTEPISLTTSLKATIKGGFAADDPSNPAKKVAGAKTVLDGAGALGNIVSVNYAPANAVDQITLIDFAFTRSHSAAFAKAGNCVFNLQDCIFTNNPYSVITLSAGTLKLTGCTLARNQKTTANESGNMVSASAGTLNMIDCVIERNGVPFDALPTDSYTTANYLFKSSGNAPFYFTRCRFAANRIHATTSGASMFAQPVTWNSCAGMSFTDCAFVGNTLRNNGGNNNSYDCGLVYMPQNGGSKHCPFVNCTFAYNLFDVSGGALLMAASTYSATSILTVKNCIFWGNRTTTRHKGPLCIRNGSTVAQFVLGYTMFETGGASDYTSQTAIGGGEGVVVENPSFVSGSIDDLLGGDGTPGNLYFAADKEDEVAALDVHLLAHAGYRKNGDPTWHTDTATVSKAIDAGDPTMAVGDEPAPNGGIINLGAYGGTAEASKTEVTEPAATVTSVIWPNEYTQPIIKVTMGGMGAYNAKVRISVSTNGTDWAFVSDEFANVQNGDVIDWLSSGYMPVDGAFKVKIDIVAPGATPFSWTSGNYDVPSGKIIPPWAGKGGDPDTVIHVRIGATGAKTGRSWTTAYDNLEDALAVLNANVATKKEVWIAGNPEIGAEYDTTTWSIGTPVVVRGGFAATENTPEERLPGARSMLDGADLRKGFTVSTIGTATLEFDRLVFSRFTTAALKRSSGSTALVVSNCVFTANPASSVVISAGATTIAKTTFEGNVKTNNQAGTMVTTTATLTLVDCDIVTNGVPFDAAPTVSCPNAAYLFNNTETCGGMTFQRCRFVGNRLQGSSAALITEKCDWRNGLIRLDHCLFLGNVLRQNPKTASTGGLVYYTTATAGDCPVTGCTFAYNLLDMSTASLLLRRYDGCKATVTVKNCIFYGNRTTSRVVQSPYMDLLGTGAGKVSYTLSEKIADRLFMSTGGITEGDGLDTGSPDFVSGSIDDLLGGDGTPDNLYFAADKADEVCALDVHLLTPAGYRKNDDPTWYEDAEVVSRAIDAGDPTMDVGDEPEPNGGKINLGCYGGTAEASKTAECNPEASITSVTWPNEYTQPLINIHLGGTGIYSATVVVTVYTNVSDSITGEEIAAFVSKPFVGYPNGADLAWLVSGYVPENGRFRIGVSVTAPGADDKELTTDPYDSHGTTPPWAGKGGDPETVIHVRAGATGAKDGTSWTDAFDNIYDAFNALGLPRGKTVELWVAGEFALDERADANTLIFSSPILVRGGFEGVENSPEERRDRKAVATIDGEGIRRGLVIQAVSAYPLVLENLKFTGMATRALNKTEKGALFVTNCVFSKCGGAIASMYGRAIYSHWANITLSGTTFSENVLTNATKNAGYFGGLVAVGEHNGDGHDYTGSLTVDNCLVVSNGLPLTYAFVTNELMSASVDAVFFHGHTANLRITNSRFIGNRVRSGGIVNTPVHWTGFFRNMLFDHNLFMANECVGRVSSRTESNGSSGEMMQLGVHQGRAVVKNCTFAFNVVDRLDQGPGFYLSNTDIAMTNTIFSGNVNACGAASPMRVFHFRRDDTYGLRSGHVDYSFFDRTNCSYTTRADITNYFGNGVLYGDARLVSTTNDFAKLVKKDASGYLYLDWENDAEKIMALNAHLQGTSGYTDETTGKKVAGKGKTSPCVDKGDPASDWSQEPKPNGKRINMGCYGGTPWATRSPGGGALFIR